MSRSFLLTSNQAENPNRRPPNTKYGRCSSVYRWIMLLRAQQHVNKDSGRCKCSLRRLYARICLEGLARRANLRKETWFQAEVPTRYLVTDND
jgi:hypothetical protein